MDIEYAEPTELDLKLEKMALFMECSRKVVKYRSKESNSSNEFYYELVEEEMWCDKNGAPLDEELDSLRFHLDWNWLHPVIKKLYDIVSFQMDFELHLEQTLEALKWHTFMGDIKEAFNICNRLIDKINNR